MNAPAVATNIHDLRNPAPKEAQLPAVQAGFFNLQSFELMQRISKGFAASTLVPKEYQDNVANCMIALNLAQRIGADPLLVMQNLVIVHGRPTWSAQFLIATVNTCGRFSALRYEFFGQPGTEGWGCRAWAVEKATGEKLVGTDVTIAIAKKEGWYGKSGSKWQSIPQQMLMYRAGAWWTRAYAPELSMGLHTADEMVDIYDAERGVDGAYQVATVEQLRETGAAGETNATGGGVAPAQSSVPGEAPRAVEEPAGAGDTQGGATSEGAEGTATPTDSTAQPASGTHLFDLTDVLQLVKAGKIDEARDAARALPENEQRIVEQNIANKAGGQPMQRRARGGISAD